MPPERCPAEIEKGWEALVERGRGAGNLSSILAGVGRKM